jgi:hypothetical protein
MYVIWKDVVSVDPCGIGASADWQYRHFNASSCTRSLRNGQIFITRFSTAASAASTTMTGELRISVVCVGTDEAENAILGYKQLASRYEPLELPACTDWWE